MVPCVFPYRDFLLGHYQQAYLKDLDDSFPKANESAAKRIAQIVSRLPAGSVYLAVGAGRGKFERDHLQKDRPFLSVLVDFAELRPLPTSSRTVHIRGDANLLPVTGASVDIVSCLFAKDLFGEHGHSTMELFRVLKPGGFAVIYLHHRSSMQQKLKRNDDILSEYLAARKKLLSCKQSPNRDDKLEMIDASIIKCGQYSDFFLYLLSTRGQLFSNLGEIREHFSSHGFEVIDVFEHKPVRDKSPQDCWWEVVVRKPD
jgi:ubiquinone/menaquinone biosynthesis C-methylase UbiE